MTTTAIQIDFLASGLNDPDTGQSYSGAIVAFFEAGTTTPKAVWLDRAKTLPTVAGLSQTTLDSNGVAILYGDGNYKINIYAPEDTGLTTPLDGSIDGAEYIPSVETQSILAYSTLVDYVALESSAIGSDGNIYKCLISNGPSSSLVDPVGDETGTWYGLFSQTLVVVDEKASSVDGGAFLTGDWRDRTLNTVRSNSIAGAIKNIDDISVNLPIGVYSAKISAPAFQVEEHQIRLYNITGTTQIDLGSSEYSGTLDSVQSRSFLETEFELTTASDIKVEHQCDVDKLNGGFGVANIWANNVYTIAKFTKIG